jgi:pentatricopeptide repeat protein
MTIEDKKSAALGLVGECAAQLPSISDARKARGLAASLAARAHELQGGDRDRPYFTRTISQLAHVLRSHGWVEIASETLEWGIARGAIDGYVLSEVAECHLARGDVSGAEAALERARAGRLPTDAIYTSLVKAYGRSGHPDHARLVFDRAVADSAVTPFIYPALIAAYASAGDIPSARQVFEQAAACGQLSAPAFTALAAASAVAGDLAGVDQVLAMARAAGHMSGRLALTAIRSRLNIRQFADARRVLEDAKREGSADGTCYSAIITACHRAGRHREAKRVHTSATTDPRLTADDLRCVNMAHRRNRRPAAPGAAERRNAA